MLCEICMRNKVSLKFIEDSIVKAKVCKDLKCFLKVQKYLQSQDLKFWEEFNTNPSTFTKESKRFQKQINLYDEDLQALLKDNYVSDRMVQTIVSGQQQSLNNNSPFQIIGPFEFQELVSQSIPDQVTSLNLYISEKDQNVIFLYILTSYGENSTLLPIILYGQKQGDLDDLGLSQVKHTFEQEIHYKVKGFLETIWKDQVKIRGDTLFYTIEQPMLNLLDVLLSGQLDLDDILKKLSRKSLTQEEIKTIKNMISSYFQK